MLKVQPTPVQIRAALVKCRAQLQYLVRRSEELLPGSAYIDRARQAELTEIVIHAVLTVQALPSGAALFKTQISRAYAKGVAGVERTPTLESVRTITAVLDKAIAELSDRETARPFFN